jgi:site-specific recombinase XerD
MSTFRLRSNGSIYIYHYYGDSNPIRISTKLKIEQNKWDTSKQKAKSSNYKSNGKFINRELVKHEAAIEKAVQFYEQNQGFSTRNFIAKYREFLNPGSLSGAELKKVKFLEFFQKSYDKLKDNKHIRYKSYGTTLNHLKTYFNNIRPAFEDIDLKFYREFSEYLLSQNLSKNTISNHWKHIKAIMHDAQVKKLHDNSEYESFKRTREESDTIYLSESELDAIYDLKLSGTKDKVRDYFLIGCYTGLRYSDWDQLSSSIIKDGMASIRAAKTGELSMIPIHPRVKAILKKYNGTLPKKLSIQKMNEYIKAIGMNAKINSDVETRITKGGKVVKTTQPKYMLMSTHTARRTFASVLVLKGISPYLIMKITGHRTVDSFEKYVRIKDLQASVELKSVDFFK